MGKLEVEMASSSNEGKCSVQRVFFGFLFCVVVGLVGLVCYLSLKDIEHDDEINSLKRESEFNLREANKTKFRIQTALKNDLRQYIDRRTSGSNTKEPIKTADDNITVPSIGPELRASFKDMNERLNDVISMIGNLSEGVLRMNRSSDSKINHLRINIKKARYDLIRLSIEMMQLNNTVHRKLSDFVFTVKDVRKDFDTLRNSTVTNVTQLWRHWNKTNQVIEDVIKLMTRQNETLHFKIAYHSDILYSKVKDLEKKQLKFHNKTKTSLNNLRGDLNSTRDILQVNFHNKITEANKSWHDALQVFENSIASLRSSVTNLSRKVATVENDLQTKINDIETEEKKMKKDFEEISKDYQEQDRKHVSAISKQKTETETLKEKVANLEQEKILNSRREAQQNKDIKDLKKRIEELKNGANSIPGSNIKFIVLTVFIVLFHNYLN